MSVELPELEARATRHPMSEELPLVEYRYGFSRRLCFFLLVLMVCGSVALPYLAFFHQPSAPSPPTGGFEMAAIKIAACLGPVATGIMAYAFASTFTHRMRIALTPTALICPKPSRWGISKEEITVPFAAIDGVAVEPFIGKARMIRIDAGTKRIQLPSNMLPDRNAFDDLTARLREARSRRY